jgi:hypothetical protein
MITTINQNRSQNITEVRAASDLSGTVFYHWYSDGNYLGVTAEGKKAFFLSPGSQSRVSVVDTTDPEFDPVANNPGGFPSRKKLFWLRSFETIAEYRIEQKIGEGSWTTLAKVPHDSKKWMHEFLTQPLKDLTVYTWRVFPVDAAGKAGDPVVIGPETIVRMPDAPKFSAVFDPETLTVTIAA